MNGSENKFLKQNKADMTQHTCICSSRYGLFISNRHASFFAAALILLLFFVFVSGYFSGQRHAVTNFSSKIEQDSFADQIYSSMCTIGDYDHQMEHEHLEDAIELAKSIDSSIVNFPENNEKIDVTHDETGHKKQAVESQVAPQVKYYAQLIGFGTAQAAHKFAQRMNTKGIPVEVRKRNSKTAKGRTISWYQVVTAPFQDKAELEAFLDRIIKEEKLKDVRTVTC